MTGSSDGGAEAREASRAHAGAAVADARFSSKERLAIASAVAKIISGSAAERSGRRFEDDAAAFMALLRDAAERR